MTQQKRVLVAGGAGFIGSHLCGRLLSMGYRVICMDNFHTGRLENIAHLISNPCFELIDHNIEERYEIKVDQIYNLACPASPIHYQYDPIRTFKTAVIGTLNMLGIAKANAARMVQASTSEVYGDPICHPQKEDYWGNVNPVGIRSCYDEGKRGAETLCMDYHRKHGVVVKIVRIFNTYGPNMSPNDGRVISNFITQTLKGEDISIYGDGSQTRSFQYIDDLVDGLIRVMDTDDSFAGPINLGNPHEYSVRELAQKVIELTGAKSELKYHSLPEDDPKQRQPDIELARKMIAYNPSVELSDGLKKTILYFKGE